MLYMLMIIHLSAWDGTPKDVKEIGVFQTYEACSTEREYLIKRGIYSNTLACVGKSEGVK